MVASIRPPAPPTPSDDLQCARCGIDFHVGDPPLGVACLWIVCPQCGVRMWHAEPAASMLLGLHDFDDAKTSWQPGFTIH